MKGRLVSFAFLGVLERALHCRMLHMGLRSIHHIASHVTTACILSVILWRLETGVYGRLVIMKTGKQSKGWAEICFVSRYTL